MDEKQRNKRLFGALTGQLDRFKKEQESFNTQNENRIAIEKKLYEKLQKEKKELESKAFAEKQRQLEQLSECYYTIEEPRIPFLPSIANDIIKSNKSLRLK